MSVAKPLTLPFEDWEALIRKGRSPEVSKAIRQLNLKKVARQDFSKLANMARRLQHHEISLRLLNPVVRSQLLLSQPANNDEVFEYALSLNRIGAFDEALELLHKVSPKEVPAVYMHRAFTYISQWNYKKAASNLKRFINNTPNNYMSLVAQVNLAASLVYIKSNEEDTHRLLDTLIASTAQQDHGVLLGNALEIKAQLCLNQKDYDQAESLLVRSHKALHSAQRLDSFFAEKWIAVLQALRGETFEPLLQVRQKAALLGHWESVRDCDLQLARIEQDPEKLKHIYFGTPFASFRKNIIQAYPGALSLPRKFLWRLDGTPSTSAPVVDVALGKTISLESSPMSFELDPGKLLHRLLGVLASDFYRPFRLGHLFAQMFKEEYFDPMSSPGRVYKSIERLRREFVNQELDLDIRVINNQYQLVAKGPVGLMVPRSPVLISPEISALSRIQAKWGKEPFSTRLAAKEMELSVATINRLLQQGLRQGKLKRIGQGPSTRYLFS